MAAERQYNSFGPYRLGKTIGEGEFGKVKIATQSSTQEQVAIKLIKKESVAQPSRHNKLVREITILQSLNHRYIVKLLEVIETDAYIGMIMEYASGGELFEHILARRYLKEAEAGKLFAQLIAGVSYLHNSKIVHRDLKLENLLLDGSRNVIITDFGFANLFSENKNSLLQTSCGSPCYAAPELVVSDGYHGESADIWSLGVILYAMLCGYLPFDDDPLNPEGENINLLYKYIMETPLEFPPYVPEPARSLVRRILVPDPNGRADMVEVQNHIWLRPFYFIYAAEANQTIKRKSDEKLANIDSTENLTTHVLSPASSSSESPLPQGKPSLESVKAHSVISDALAAPISPTQSVPPTAASKLKPVSTVFVQSIAPVSPRTPKDEFVVKYGHPSKKKEKQKTVPLKGSLEDVPKKDYSRGKSMDVRPKAKEEEPVKDSRKSMSAPQPRGLKKPTAQKKPVQVKSRTELQKLKLHTGPIDQRALSTKGPAELLDETVGVLQSMGLLIEKTGSPYKLVVIRPETTKEVEVYSTPVSDLTKKTSLLSIGSSKTRKKANYLSSFPVSFVKQIKYFAQFGSGYNSGYDGSTKTDPTEGKIMMEKKEIRMNLYINRIKNLDGLVIVDLKRLRGDIWQFKALYNELILKLSSNTPGYHFEE